MVKKTKKDGQLSVNWKKLIKNKLEEIDSRLKGNSYFMSLRFVRKQTFTLIFKETLAKYCLMI